MPSTTEKFVRRVYEWLAHRDTNAAWLAKQLGITSGALSLKLAGKRRIDLDFAGRIADAMGVPLSDLVQDSAATPPDRPKETDAERALQVLADAAGVKIRVERKKS